MQTITFSWTLSAANKTRVIAGIAGQHGYVDQIPDPVDGDKMIANPESKGAFALRMAKKWIIENVKAWEVDAATDAARDAKIAEVESIEIT